MTLSEHVLPPADAPFVPGGGPLHRHAVSRARGWLRWWWASAGLGALGAVALVAVFVVDAQTPAMFVWFGCWIAAVLCMVPAHRLGWVQRHDRHDDEFCTYATGVRVDTHLLGDPATVRLAGRTIATSAWDSRSRRRVVRLGDRALTLEERITARSGRHVVQGVALRLVDDRDEVAATARGERRGDHVDWTLDLPLGELRLRQRLDAVPTRRTLLDGWGRAWRVRADLETAHWSIDLPEEAGPVDAVFVTWFASHLDALGLRRCYPARGVAPVDGPAMTTVDGDPTRRAPDGPSSGAGDARWIPVGVAGPRPEIPKAEGGVDL